MNVQERLQQLMWERGWTEYRLAKEADLSQSTITNLFVRNSLPSIPTLELICNAFGITLAQFFAQGNFVELTEEQQVFFTKWSSLTAEQKTLLFQLIEQMK